MDAKDVSVILASGCFDGLHAGHMLYLDAAKGLCEHEEELVVAVACDDYIRQAKGRQPRWPLEHRMLAVAHVQGVDHVLMHAADGAAGVIAAARPRLFVKGGDWIDRLPPDVLRACYDAGCAVAFVPVSDVAHTSEGAD